MFDVAPTELMMVALVALLVIGPKDLPRVMRYVGRWVGKGRGMAAQFRSGFDAMVREAELEDMEKAWAKENERIMREYPMVPNASTTVATDASEPSSGEPEPALPGLEAPASHEPDLFDQNQPPKSDEKA